MKKLYNIYQKALYLLGIILLQAIVILIAIQVLSRYLKFTSPWTEELSRYSFLLLTCFGAAAVFQDNLHIRIDSFISLAPQKIQIIVRIIIDVVIVGLMGLFFAAMLKVMSGTARISLVTIPSVGVNVVYTLVDVAVVLIIIANILDIIRIFYKPLDQIMTETAQEGREQEEYDVL